MLLLATTICLVIAKQPGWKKPPPPGPSCKDCPNIIFSLTDDQDIELGGWDPMHKTQALLGDSGVSLTRWRIHTPICSPSRSEAISGRYFHNIKSFNPVPANVTQAAGCTLVNGTIYSEKTVQWLLREQKGYKTALFGKAGFGKFHYAEGWDRYFSGTALSYQSSFFDNEGADQGKSQSTFINDIYTTYILGNRTVEWIKRDNVTGQESEGRPFFIYFAPHCPHTPASPAIEHMNHCENTFSPRNPAYNHTNSLFHELVRGQPPLTDIDALLIDGLARRRCQCLLAVDDANAGIYQATIDAKVADKTYWFISSDHGYNLGHHRLPSNKFLLYDHTLRIPFIVNGPGIKPGENTLLGTNVDYAPSFLGLAGIDTPDYMDGRSILAELIPAENEHLLLESTKAHVQKLRSKNRDWRIYQFFEYYNQGGPSPFSDPDVKFEDQGWAPRQGDLLYPRFPGQENLVATKRPLDDYSNTYIGLFSTNSSIGSGKYKYGEFRKQCSSQQLEENSCFNEPDFYELFDLTKDPYHLNNIYYENSTSQEVKEALHSIVQSYYHCKGLECM